MLFRETLFTCASCGSHLRAPNDECPHCGARRVEAIAGAGPLAVGLIALTAACGGSVTVGQAGATSGGGGAGGATNVAASSANSAVSSAAASSVAASSVAASSAMSSTGTINADYGPAPTCDDPFDPPPCNECTIYACCPEIAQCKSGDCTALATCKNQDCSSVCGDD